MNFFFEFFEVVGYVNGFSYIEPTLHPWDEAYLIVVNDGFDVFSDSVCKSFRILLRIFALIFISKIGLKFPFLLGPCVVYVPE